MLSFTVDNVNSFMKIIMNDPVGKPLLVNNFVEVLQTHFQLTLAQKHGLSKIPIEQFDNLRRAIKTACETPGGYIRLTGGPEIATLVVSFRRHNLTGGGEAQPRAASKPFFSCSVELFGASCRVST